MAKARIPLVPLMQWFDSTQEMNSIVSWDRGIQQLDSSLIQDAKTQQLFFQAGIESKGPSRCCWTAPIIPNYWLCGPGLQGAEVEQHLVFHLWPRLHSQCTDQFYAYVCKQVILNSAELSISKCAKDGIFLVLSVRSLPLYRVCILHTCLWPFNGVLLSPLQVIP